MGGGIPNPMGVPIIGVENGNDMFLTSGRALSFNYRWGPGYRGRVPRVCVWFSGSLFSGFQSHTR